jgi:hypothetical protein
MRFILNKLKLYEVRKHTDILNYMRFILNKLKLYEVYTE